MIKPWQFDPKEYRKLGTQNQVGAKPHFDELVKIQA